MMNSVETMEYDPVDFMAHRAMHNSKAMSGIADEITIMREKNIGGISFVDGLGHVCGTCTRMYLPELIAGAPENRSIDCHMRKTVRKTPPYKVIGSTASMTYSEVSSYLDTEVVFFAESFPQRISCTRYPNNSGR